MAVARHGTGPGPAVRALASQVHPVFMLPPLASSALGALLARSASVSPSLATLHLGVVFVALYTAHVKDGYVDFHRRGEDDDHPLTAGGCRAALLGASIAFFAGTTALGVVVGPGAALLALPGWLVGVLHAPQLDTNPITATAGYPLGVGFALVGGHYVQAGALAPVPVALAAVFVVTLSGIKVIDDAKDYDYDRSVEKRTVAVVLGRARARRVAFGLMASGMVAVAGLAATGVLPLSAAGAPVPFAVVAALAAGADAEHATMLLIRGSYVFLAVLVAAVWFRPLA